MLARQILVGGELLYVRGPALTLPFSFSVVAKSEAAVPDGSNGQKGTNGASAKASKDKKAQKTKRSPNAYALYVRDCWKNESEKIKPPAMLKELGERWRSLPAVEKSKYQELAKSGRVAVDSEAGERKLRRPSSAYLDFVKERLPSVQAENPSMKATDRIKLVADLWRSMPDEERERRLAASRERMLLWKTGKQKAEVSH